MEKLDLSFLANMPKGRELYSTVFGVVTFQGIDESSDYPSIKVYDGELSTKHFSLDGKFANLGECVLFPSRGCRNWNDWQGVLIKQFDFTIDSFGGVEYIENKYKDNSIAVRFATSARKANFERSYISCWASSERIAEFKKELSGNGWMIDKNDEVVEIKPDFKQGDVIAVDMKAFGMWIGIFKSYEKGKLFSSYCYLSPSGGFIKSGGNGHNFSNGAQIADKEQCDLLFNEIHKAGYEWDAEKLELREIKAVEPKFKINDWITNGKYTRQIKDISDDGYGFYDPGVCLSHSEVNKDYHLWTIKDAKVCDILVNSPGYVFFFKDIDENGNVDYFCSCDLACGKFDIPTPVDSMGHINSESDYKKYSPASLMQQNALLSSMTKAGYKFNRETLRLERIELKKLGETICVGLRPFDKVLVRDKDDEVWRCDIFSHIKADRTEAYSFVCVGNEWEQCIPYREETTSLIGTTQAPPRFYYILKD